MGNVVMFLYGATCIGVVLPAILVAGGCYFDAMRAQVDMVRRRTDRSGHSGPIDIHVGLPILSGVFLLFWAIIVGLSSLLISGTGSYLPTTAILSLLLLVELYVLFGSLIHWRTLLKNTHDELVDDYMQLSRLKRLEQTEPTYFDARARNMKEEKKKEVEAQTRAKISITTPKRRNLLR